jgi:hypothetical protein
MFVFSQLCFLSVSVKSSNIFSVFKVLSFSQRWSIRKKDRKDWFFSSVHIQSRFNIFPKLADLKPMRQNSPLCRTHNHNGSIWLWIRKPTHHYHMIHSLHWSTLYPCLHICIISVISNIDILFYSWNSCIHFVFWSIFFPKTVNVVDFWTVYTNFSVLCPALCH